MCNISFHGIIHKRNWLAVLLYLFTTKNREIPLKNAHIKYDTQLGMCICIYMHRVLLLSLFSLAILSFTDFLFFFSFAI